jgi:hypothetical protein
MHDADFVRTHCTGSNLQSSGPACRRARYRVRFLSALLAVRHPALFWISQRAWSGRAGQALAAHGGLRSSSLATAIPPPEIAEFFFDFKGPRLFCRWIWPTRKRTRIDQPGARVPKSVARQSISPEMVSLIRCLGDDNRLFCRSGEVLSMVVGVLVEVPVMLSVVHLVRRSRGWYERVARPRI